MVQYAGIPAKLAYENLEMRRFIAAHALDQFRMNPSFPVSTLLLLRGADAADAAGVPGAFVGAALAAMCENNHDMSNRAVFVAVFNAAGFGGRRLLARTQEQSIKDALAVNTQAPVATRTFGIPTFLIGGEIFFCRGPVGTGRSGTGLTATVDL